MSLSSQDKESFEANGYLLKKSLVSQQEIKQKRKNPLRYCCASGFAIRQMRLGIVRHRAHIAKR